jgi:hypothetical protein
MHTSIQIIEALTKLARGTLDHHGIAELRRQLAPAAQPYVLDGYEHEKALKEGRRIAAEIGYFSARTFQRDTLHNRKLFEAGCDRGYEAAGGHVDA